MKGVIRKFNPSWCHASLEQNKNSFSYEQHIFCSESLKLKYPENSADPAPSEKMFVIAVMYLLWVWFGNGSRKYSHIQD